MPSEGDVALRLTVTESDADGWLSRLAVSGSFEDDLDTLLRPPRRRLPRRGPINGDGPSRLAPGAALKVGVPPQTLDRPGWYGFWYVFGRRAVP